MSRVAQLTVLAFIFSLAASQNPLVDEGDAPYEFAVDDTSSLIGAQDEKRAPMDRSSMVRFGKRAPMDRSAMVRFGKRAPMDRSAMVRFGRADPEEIDRVARAPMDRSSMVRFGKRAPMDRSAMVRFGKRAPMDRSAMVRFGRAPMDRFGKRSGDSADI